MGDVAAGLLWLAVAVAVMSALATLRARNLHARLHFPGMISSVSGPLIALAVLLQAGPGLTALTVAAIALLSALTTPVLTAAVGKLNTSTGRDTEAESR
ncbi:monovalent cation/H(+) antiporter subunit G [Nocardia terpenica]|uniref:Sodium:proton antiporter n=1 Tax=Nocardia terpenica TaxID=455432 RepID=A0A6G9Z6R1_9NOCA|nr:monovalent cation/H(+) antiporter subunit G [Nocardia terpenica]QIS21140.1 hypothetical protein F6W96_25265 [Nocardia terpenica]